MEEINNLYDFINELKVNDLFIIGTSAPINIRVLLYQITKKLILDNKKVLFVSTLANKVDVMAYMTLDTKNDNLSILDKFNQGWLSRNDIIDEITDKKDNYDYIIIDNIALLYEAERGTSYKYLKVMAHGFECRLIGVNKYVTNNKPTLKDMDCMYYKELNQYVDYVLLFDDSNTFDDKSKSLISVEGELIKVRTGQSREFNNEFKFKDIEMFKKLMTLAKALGLSEDEALIYAINYKEG